MRPDTTKWLVVLLGLILGLLAGPGLRVGLSYAESESRGIELLTRATKTYEAGAYGDAAALIEAAFKAGLTGETAARAILLRAEINEKNGALARALQDYSNALWMDVLGAQDRQAAANGKERVMAAMGLNSPAAPAPRPQQRSVVSNASSSSSSVAPEAHADSSSAGVFGYFSGIFGSSDAKPEASPAQPQPQQSAQAPAVAGAKPAPAPKKSADKAPPKAAPAKAAPAKVAQASKPAATKASLQPASALSVASGPEGFLIVFGTANSEASGRATAKSIKAQLSDILVNRMVDVAPKGAGFLVQAGPYKTKSSALALCSAMSQRGVPCQVTP